jgi:hypothetical protein
MIAGFRFLDSPIPSDCNRPRPFLQRERKGAHVAQRNGIGEGMRGRWSLNSLTSPSTSAKTLRQTGPVLSRKRERTMVDSIFMTEKEMGRCCYCSYPTRLPLCQKFFHTQLLHIFHSRCQPIMWPIPPCQFYDPCTD